MAKQAIDAMSARVLCVDDDSYLADLLRYALTSAGYTVHVAQTGTAALQIAQSSHIDVAIVDINLPDMDGRTLCAALRRDFNLRVILLTARHLEPDVISGFEHGADDYVTKPFNMKILLARLRTVLAREPATRARANDKKKRLFRLGPAVFNAEYNQILAGSQTIKLTRTEGNILELLMTHEGQIFPAGRLIEQARGYDTESNPAVIKTHVLNLRAKIALAIGNVQVIHTVPGVGYTYRRAPRPSGEEAE